MVSPAVLLTIAGFDPSSGAGITADLQVFAAHSFFGVSAITALTVQSTQGVFAVESVDRDILRRTLNCLADDIPLSGIKIGMIPNQSLVEEVAQFLERFATGNPKIPIVCDPVLRSSSGTNFFAQAGKTKLLESLLGRVSWITPNWSELASLTDMQVSSQEQAEAAMQALGRRYPQLNTVATGGDCDVPTDLVRTAAGKTARLTGDRVETTSTHGTGCAFSSALLCGLVRGDESLVAVAHAKAYVEGGLRNAPGIGKGRGPIGYYGHRC